MNCTNQIGKQLPYSSASASASSSVRSFFSSCSSFVCRLRIRRLRSGFVSCLEQKDQKGCRRGHRFQMMKKSVHLLWFFKVCINNLWYFRLFPNKSEVFCFFPERDDSALWLFCFSLATAAIIHLRGTTGFDTILSFFQKLPV